MSPRVPSWRTALPLVLSIVVIVYLAVSESVPEQVSELDVDRAYNNDKLRISWVDPVKLSPGAAVIVHLTGADSRPVRPRVSVGGDKTDAPVLHREGDRVVVQMPRDIPPGPVKLRVWQGDSRSRPRLLQVQSIPTRDVLRDVLGGLALLLLGLRTIGLAFRTYAGQRVRALLARMTRGRLRAVSLGTMVGGLTQSTTSGAGVLAGLLDARMLQVRTAVVMLLGVQLGAAAAGAILPLIATREALWVVALGVLWSALADNRHARAFGNIIVGCGMLFLGLKLLHNGFRPLVADPELLPYLHHLRAQGAGGLLLAAGAGALMCGVLQGPGPVFAVVLSLAQSSGLIGLREGVAVLAGTALGAVVGTAAVSLPFGERGRRLAMGHLVFAALMSAVALAGVPLWVWLADVLVGGDPGRISYTGRVLLPEVGWHLGVAFGVSQVLSVGVALVAFRHVLPWIERAVTPGRTPAPAPEPSLAGVLHACRRALEALEQVTETGERAPAVIVERNIDEAREGVERLLAATKGERDSSTSAAMACLHLTSAVDAALGVAERALERDFTPSGEDADSLRGLHGLLMQGLDSLTAHVRGEALLSLEEAQAREIRLNALEAAARRPGPEATKPVAYRLWFGELLVAYESIGNHVYRVAAALAPASDEPLL